MQECKQSEKHQKSYCARIKRESNGDTEAFCPPWGDINESCRPDHLRQNPCPHGTRCITQMAKMLPDDVIPPRVVIEESVFWQNEGPDVMMDMAGKIQLSNNLYLFCLPFSTNPQCKPKRGYKSCVPGKEDGCQSAKGTPAIGYRKIPLPNGTSIIWQNSSPFDSPFDSQLQGNDLLLTHAGFSLLFRPGTCDLLSSR